MPIPNRALINQIFAKDGRASKLHGAILRAWDTATTKYPERARWVRKSTFRAIVWEYVINEFGTLADGDASFNAVFHRDTASFMLDDAVLFRFKRADLSLSTANYPTTEAVAFDDHSVDLYGYKGLQRVELCYVLSEFETEVVWVGISARSNGEFLWKIEITSDGIVVDDIQPDIFDEEFDPMRIASLKQGKSDEANKEKKKDNG